MTTRLRIFVSTLIGILSTLKAHSDLAPIKLFIVAGDELVLEQGVIDAKGKPGTLMDVVSKRDEYSFLKQADGTWSKRNDVVLFDAHPIHNNTESMGTYLTVGDPAYGGRRARGMIGIEQSLGHVLGEHYSEPVLLLRFGTHHPASFRRGSRTLAHDYLPPSSGGEGVGEQSWDIIHFNWGIWDIAYRDPKPDNKWHSCVINGKLTTPLDVYENNLRQLVAKMKATGATLVWAHTTPVHPDTPGRKAEDPSRYNAVAEKIMKENGVMVSDLYSESIRQGFPKKPDVHSTGNLASKAIEGIEAALATRKNANKVPRILLIGDSITGSYQNAVSKHFAGRAEVYKNPGNGEHTGTGLRHIDSWIHPKTYQFSGQEYMELVNGVKKTLADMDRYYPGYQRQKVELAGMVWFHGAAETHSASDAAAYAKHLSNLIKDLRKDLDAPELPTVVAAIGWENNHAQTIRKAQLTIADSVPRSAAIDTRPFLYPADQSPGERADMYRQHAGSYLDIGREVGKKLIELHTASK